ncbi:hypothetical protein PPERSA_12150 [Pseudocohnilembus persalinus]|uniref:Uncharacterized protein n=1 Tax=Pseudocohnilembus persalinus TaxID=266149 RepID=A0A0V0QNL6_PSEPJ|nr:hypothetical protein PPERSA_12150 [Pseudocohnilembus persalinus]|eukprot:KRX03945.1 hypothetical protein PPERSA_12150 [Pseudocohnilembus persalinus]
MSQDAVDEKFQNNQQFNNKINDGIQLQSKYSKKQDDCKFDMEAQNFFESPHRKRYNSLILHDRYSLSEKKMISYYQQIQNMFSKNNSIENSPKNYLNKLNNETSELNGKFKRKKTTEIQGIQFDGLESDMNLSDQENEENIQNFKDAFTDFKDEVVINNNSEKQAKFQQISDLTPINAFRLIGQNVNTLQQQQNQQLQKQVKEQNFQEQVQFKNQQQQEILQNIQQIKNDNDSDDAENMGIEVRKRSNSMNNIRISLSKKSVILRKKKASVQIQFLTSVALPDSQQFEEYEQNKCNNNEKNENKSHIKKFQLDNIKKQSLLMIQSKGQYNEDKSSYSGSNSNSKSSSICQQKSDSCFDNQSSISQEQADEAKIQKEQPILDKITTI